jgi:hypothetical protein
MALGVVFLDMFEISCFFEPRHTPVQSFQPVVDLWVIMSDCPEVRLEMLDFAVSATSCDNSQTNLPYTGSNLTTVQNNRTSNSVKWAPSKYGPPF